MDHLVLRLQFLLTSRYRTFTDESTHMLRIIEAQPPKNGAGLFRCYNNLSVRGSMVMMRSRSGARVISRRRRTVDGSPPRRRRRCTISAPHPAAVVPVPAAVINHLNTIIIPVFISGRCRSHHHRCRRRRGSHHDRGRGGSRSHHNSRSGFHRSPDQVHNIRSQTDAIGTSMMMVMMWRRGWLSRCCRGDKQKPCCDSCQHDLLFHVFLLFRLSCFVCCRQLPFIPYNENKFVLFYII